MGKVDNKIFRELNIQKYIIENLKEDNITLYKKNELIDNHESIIFEMEDETRIVIIFHKSGFGFHNIEIVIEKKSYQYYNKIISKTYKWYTNFYFISKIMELRKQKKFSRFSMKEKKLISELPLNFVRECNINILK